MMLDIAQVLDYYCTSYYVNPGSVLCIFIWCRRHHFSCLITPLRSRNCNARAVLFADNSQWRSRSRQDRRICTLEGYHRVRHQVDDVHDGAYWMEGCMCTILPLCAQAPRFCVVVITYNLYWLVRGVTIGMNRKSSRFISRL